MNYEKETEGKKGLTKCLNFKRPGTILRVQVACPACSRNVYRLFAYITGRLRSSGSYMATFAARGTHLLLM